METFLWIVGGFFALAIVGALGAGIGTWIYDWMVFHLIGPSPYFDEMASAIFKRVDLPDWVSSAQAEVEKHPEWLPMIVEAYRKAAAEGVEDWLKQKYGG